MASNGRNNVSPAIMARVTRKESRLFWKEEGQEKSEYVPVVNRNSISDLMATPDVPAVSKTDSINGGKKSMQVLRWIVQQAWGLALLAIGVVMLVVVVVAFFAGVAFGWELGSMLAAWAFGG